MLEYSLLAHDEFALALQELRCGNSWFLVIKMFREGEVRYHNLAD